MGTADGATETVGAVGIGTEGNIGRATTGILDDAGSAGVGEAPSGRGLFDSSTLLLRSADIGSAAGFIDDPARNLRSDDDASRRADRSCSSCVNRMLLMFAMDFVIASAAKNKIVFNECDFYAQA